ncbi:MAG: glycosyltransferase family 4 protein [Pedobacter sp.]
MKVLWISNVLFPDVCNSLGIAIPAVGGWMYASALGLMQTNPEIRLTVVALYGGKTVVQITDYDISYYLVPNNGENQHYNPMLEDYFINIYNSVKPDIVHIHGSEYPHSLAWVKACGNLNVVVSIQGLVSVYAEFFLGGIPEKIIKKHITIRDILRSDSLFQQQTRMRERGLYERQLIKSSGYIIGRTSWDKSHSLAINPNISYHFCNETLRPMFYKKKWDFDECLEFSIFLSQAHYPIKGIQQIIKALPIILRRFPKTKMFVAGDDFMKKPSFKKNGFANYISSLILANGLTNKIEFVGMLNEEEMVKMYLRSHIFVCPSSIENSPNSVGEAQLLGIPTLASYVGGTMDMIEEGNSGYLFRFEEIQLMAMRICEIFSNRDLAERLSKNAMNVASIRHDAKANAEQLNNIYQKISNETILNLQNN